VSKGLSAPGYGLQRGKRLAVNAFKAVSVAREIVEHARQGVMQFVDSLDAVVKNDDRPGSGVLHHIFEALLRRYVRVEIAAEYVPHHDMVVALQELSLLGAQPAVGRSEQIGLHQVGAVADIVKIGDIIGSPAIEVVESVVAQSVALIGHHLRYIAVFAQIIAHTKKRGFGVVCGQLIEYPGSDFGNGAVVESEVDDFFFSGQVPNEVGKQALNKLRRFYEIHGFGFMFMVVVKFSD
jgi:hypothetical protein